MHNSDLLPVDETDTNINDDRHLKIYSSHNGFRIKSEIKLNWYDCNQDLVFSPPGLSAVRTGKTENQIGFSIY
ncbi:MAG: hypothetical protein D8M57_07315 [Candidatus Scalindua sp. AMX11]|nr:MAG: hypothetical protein DWQ00_05565 [Candidatus Scalindua sp.]TDE65521.1 MAG: hypothetical protein D8M57_07315 [Candidatus Scalindua sp. AMX11]